MLAKEQSNKGCFSEVSEYSGAQHHGVIDKEEVRWVVCQHLGLEEVVGRVELVKTKGRGGMPGGGEARKKEGGGERLWGKEEA